MTRVQWPHARHGHAQVPGMVLRVAHRGYVIQTGRIVLQDAVAAVLRSDLVRKGYVGEK